jgi:NitT/TauT family transport system substrate-binding protein
MLRIVCAVLAIAAAFSMPAHAQQKIAIGVGGKILIAYAQLTIAERLGYFKDEGLDAEISDFQGGSKAVEALVGGTVDVVVGGYENTVFIQTKGIDLTAIFLGVDRFGLVLALTKTAAAKYQSPKDLKGLKFGVTAPGSATANALEIILAKGGLTANDVAIIGVGGGAGAIAAIKSRQIDGLLHSDPVITRLEKDGDITVLVDSRKDDGQLYMYGGPCAGPSAYGTAKFLKDRRQTAQLFVNAMVRASKWLTTASPDEIVAVMPPEFVGPDKALYREIIAANQPSFVKDGRFTMEKAQNTVNAAMTTGRMPKDAKIDIARTFDVSFAEEANKKY